MSSATHDVLATLQQYWGYTALRPLQDRAIGAALAARDSLLVMPTGGGKSLCFQLPAVLRPGLTVVVSPLIALMKDQVDGLHLAGFPAEALNSTTKAEDAGDIRARVVSGGCKLLYVSPERLLTPSFLSWLARIHDKGGLDAFAIDEAHCISQWGHDFRPEYRRLAELRDTFPGVAFHAFTATATPRVREDILAQLRMRDAEVLVGGFDRPNLTYRVVPRSDLVWQAVSVLQGHKDRAAIIYCISRKDTESLAVDLTAAGYKARAYHAGMTPVQRTKVQQDFIEERLNIVCATVAFGMGIDRSDVRCIIHAAMPKTIEHYQQETGRAGRDGLPSECVLFHSAQDVLRWNKLMELGASESSADAESIAEGLRVQRELLGHVQKFVAGSECRHAALAAYFGQAYAPPGDGAKGCGACDVCLGGLREVEGSQEVAQKILSCVYRVGQAFGASHVVEVLRGSRSAKVMERGHDRLSTHGLLATLPKERVQRCVQQLIVMGHLAQSDDGFSTLRLTPSAGAVLKGQQPVRFFEPATDPRHVQQPSVATLGGAPLDAEGMALFDALRALRRDVAREKNVPPYLVFSDATLEEMARSRPSSTRALLGVRGIGEIKLREFGDTFVREVARFCGERGLAMDVGGPVPDARPLPEPKPRSAPRMHPAAEALFREGAPIEDVCEQIGRAPSTVYGYLCHWIEETRPASVSAWVDDALYARVVEAYKQIGGDRLRPIWDHLSGEVTYDQIRMVLSHQRATGA